MCGFSINDVFCLDLRIYIFYFIYIVDHILSSQILSTRTTRIFKALIDSVYKKLTLKLIGIIGFNNNNKISSRYFSSVVNIIYVIWFKPLRELNYFQKFNSYIDYRFNSLIVWIAYWFWTIELNTLYFCHELNVILYTNLLNCTCNIQKQV